MKKLLLITLFLFSSLANALDIRDYFANGTNKLNSVNGGDYSRYTFTTDHSGFASLYNTYLTLNKAGHTLIWQKEYKSGTGWCTKTYGVLFKGDDKSITEVGDWLASNNGCTPNVLFGYKTALSGGANTGLIWSTTDGLASVGVAEMYTAGQASTGSPYATNGSAAFSKTGLIEQLVTFQPAYGRCQDGSWSSLCGKVYTDVIHIVMYHGTKTGSPMVRCSNSPISANGAYYQSYKNYNSYAIELWLARGIGIIQENFPFVEDASYWQGAFPNCSGGVFSAPNAWTTFIDAP